MNTSESLRALERANPRGKPGFAESVAAAAEAVADRIAGTDAGAPRSRDPRPRRRLVAGATLAGAAVLATFLTVGSPGGGSGGVEDATAAIKKAGAVTAASAERSGTAIIRITHEGRPWVGSTIRWANQDLAVAQDTPARSGRAGSRVLLVVDGTMYGVEEGRWVILGSPKSIDPGSGTTPDEYLAAVREDVGGETLRRLTDGMTGLTTRRLGDGSTVYSGTVAAGLVARESGFKGGQAIRVLPFGYVAHDEAADPSAPLDAAVTVGPGGVVRELAVRWGTWEYTVSYRGLGATAAPVAPGNARPLRERSRSE